MYFDDIELGMTRDIAPSVMFFMSGRSISRWICSAKNCWRASPRTLSG